MNLWNINKKETISDELKTIIQFDDTVLLLWIKSGQILIMTFVNLLLGDKKYVILCILCFIVSGFDKYKIQENVLF